MRCSYFLLAVCASLVPVFAQRTADLPPDAGQTGKAYAPIDLTGYWVSVITEDWRYRFLAAPRGDYYAMPLRPEARKVADQWDPEKDIAQGRQCLAYGAAALLRQPTRVHITWDGDDVLKLETDAGKQTRMFSFGTSRYISGGEPTLQGNSAAQWQTPQITRFYNSKVPANDPNTPGFSGQTPVGTVPPDTRKLGGNLKVVTRNMRPGYLRNNGVPYSANAVLTEYFDVYKEQGKEYLIVTSIVDDPQYLYVPWVVTDQFRKEPDGAKWDPQPCDLILPSK